MPKVPRCNATYVATVSLWLVMAYIAWDFGYSVGRRSATRTWEYPRQDSGSYETDFDVARSHSGNGTRGVERFPRPCRLDEGVEDKRHIAVFHSVTKCAGRTILSIAFAQQHPLSLSVKSALNYSLETKDEVNARIYMNRILNAMTPPGFVYTNARFVLPSASYFKQPILVSMIRDPLQRLVSTFYHTRFGDGLKARTVGEMAWRVELEAKHVNISESFDECVKAEKPECTGERTKGALIRQFCGYHSECKTASPAALIRAKSNIKSHFMLVGILEEMDDFVKVLERLTPATFKGAFEKFENDARVQAVIADSKTVGLQSISDYTAKILRKHLALDYELYYYVQWRFMRQKQECGL